MPPQTLADARAINRKLAGYRISRDPITTEASKVESKAEKDSRTARGADFITQAESFMMLVKVVSSAPMYNPAREELKVSSLETTGAALIKANDDVGKAYATSVQVRRYRNDLFYRAPGNLVELSRMVKSHVRAMTGFNSEARRTVTKINIIIPSRI